MRWAREHYMFTGDKPLAREMLRYLERNFRGIEQQPRRFAVDEDQGLLMCTWPRGGRPKVPTLYSDEVWMGIEYEVAALLLFEGEVEPALRIVEAVRRRYDGRKPSGRPPRPNKERNNEKSPGKRRGRQRRR